MHDTGSLNHSRKDLSVSNQSIHVSHVGGTGKYRYDGYGFGVGLSYGYSKVLNKRWNLEFEAGLGVLWSDYTKYLCKTCGAPQGNEKKIYLIPSKASISLVYLF